MPTAPQRLKAGKWKYTVVRSSHRTHHTGLVSALTQTGNKMNTVSPKSATKITKQWHSYYTSEEGNMESSKQTRQRENKQEDGGLKPNHTDNHVTCKWSEHSN